MERLTRPFRYPNSVPHTRLPPEVLLTSGNRPPGRVGNLHVGVMMGKVRKTDRKTRNTLVLCLFLDAEGCMRVDDGVGGGGGDGGAEEEEDIDGKELVLILGSPITGTLEPAMGECHAREIEGKRERKIRVVCC